MHKSVKQNDSNDSNENNEDKMVPRQKNVICTDDGSFVSK